MFEKIRARLTYYLSTLALLNAAAFSGFAMAQAELEEVVVTARKKTESLQDVPISVSALRESDLEDKGINVFEDYLLTNLKLYFDRFEEELQPTVPEPESPDYEGAEEAPAEEEEIDLEF